MANTMVGHEAHAVFNGVRGVDGNNLAGNDLSHGSLFGRFAFERDFASVIALGHDADEPAVVRDQQSADVLVRH